MKRGVPDLALYLVLGRGDLRYHGLEETVAAAVRGGVSLVQLREKTAGEEEIAALARALKVRLDPLGVPLILNDHVELALAVEASGVHLGQDDMDHRAARRCLGPDKILGLSVGTPEEAVGVEAHLLDYIGIGPFAETGTKSDAGTAIGPAGLRAVLDCLPLPAVAIGGIKASNAAQAMAAGVQGLAVVSAITAVEDPEGAARELRRIVGVK